MVDLFADGWPTTGADPGLTYPADAPEKRIDFIFHETTWAAPTCARVPESVASDHRAVVVTFPAP
ncbi:MAG: hypothetical protein KC416_07495 [Myxococcales bacterium]|nr:hypothetical protein [Myxococcales bacterium]